LPPSQEGLCSACRRALEQPEIFLDFTDIALKCKQIQKQQAEGNLISCKITLQLSLTLIRPMDRQRIHELNQAQIDALNCVKALSSRIGLYGFHKIKDAAKELTTNLVAMAVEVENMLKKINSAREVGEFRKKIERIKSESEMFLLVGLGEIYDHQITDTKDIMEIIKWIPIYDRLENALNALAYVSDIIEGIIALNVTSR